MILMAYFLFSSFKSAISDTVYSDLISLVEINTAFAEKLIENGNNREELLNKLKPLYNSQIGIGKTGFLFCVDLDGNLVVHQKAEGENWKDKGFISHIIDRKMDSTDMYLQRPEPIRWLLSGSCLEPI